MYAHVRIPLMDVITCLSETVDLISPTMNRHHLQVAYIAYAIGRQMGLRQEECSDLLIAGALHDVGAFSLNERQDTLRFEVEAPHRHAFLGAALLKPFAPFKEVARIVEFHHVVWGQGAGREFLGEEVPLASHILNLADRVAVLVNTNSVVLMEAPIIRSRIEAKRNKHFAPEIVDAFMELSQREHFWFDIVLNSLPNLLRSRIPMGMLGLEIDELQDFAHLFRRIIDFRSRFTASHSSGVAECAAHIARLFGMSPNACRMMLISGYLHDLGKLGVPQEVLMKPGRLDDSETAIMRAHVYHTYRILESLPGMEDFRDCAGLHQEYLDGTGYPFHLKGDEIPFNARIMAVADIFTALTEDRPYRQGLSSAEALSITRKLASDNKIDSEVSAKVESCFGDLNEIRANAQNAANAEYVDFMQSCEKSPEVWNQT